MQPDLATERLLCSTHESLAQNQTLHFRGIYANRSAVYITVISTHWDHCTAEQVMVQHNYNYQKIEHWTYIDIFLSCKVY